MVQAATTAPAWSRGRL